MDMKDFFPSIHFKRVKGLLQELGYAEKIATILALLCTEAVTEEVGIDGKDYFVQKGQRVLPQGRLPVRPLQIYFVIRLIFGCKGWLQNMIVVIHAMPMM